MLNQSGVSRNEEGNIVIEINVASREPSDKPRPVGAFSWNVPNTEQGNDDV